MTFRQNKDHQVQLLDRLDGFSTKVTSAKIVQSTLLQAFQRAIKRQDPKIGCLLSKYRFSLIKVRFPQTESIKSLCLRTQAAGKSPALNLE